MNLRNTTIWTTGVLLLLITAQPAALLLGGFLRSDGGLGIGIAAVLWLLSGPPLLISLIIALKARSHISAAILLVVTIIYGVAYSGGWCVQYFLTSQDTGIWALGILSLPVMIPAWIAALVLDRHHAKQSEP